MLPRVLVFTDESACARRGRGVISTVAKMLHRVDAGGAVAVVVRHKRDFSFSRSLCAALRPITHKAGALLFSHDDPAIVGPLRLDGTHLSSRNSPRLARLRMPRGKILGRSGHAGEAGGGGGEAGASLCDPYCDYSTLSPIFAPRSKPDDTRAPLGLKALKNTQRTFARLYALGGVDDTNARACMSAGAAGVAVLGAVMQAPDPRRALLLLLDATRVTP